jgi:hypothetical protein
MLKKERKKQQRCWQTQLYTSRRADSGSTLLTDLKFQVVSRLFKNFTRMSPSEFEFLIHLIGGKISEKRNNIQKSHSCSRKVGNDATLFDT